MRVLAACRPARLHPVSRRDSLGGARQARLVGERAGSAVVGSEPALYTYKVVRSFPHDPTCFTQGLVYAGGNTLYESAGQYGQSNVREVDLETGAVRRRTDTSADVFGEGLALVGDTLLQLTWRSGAGLKYNAASLAPRGAFTTPLPDGWGLANGAAPDELFATDGSATLYTLDATTFAVRRSVTVTAAGLSVPMLNELEYINGEVWANIWMTECIARIDPRSGAVTGWVLMHGLHGSMTWPGGSSGADSVLNGIAWDGARKRLFITGKYWPRLFQVETRRVEGPRDGELRAAAASCTRHRGMAHLFLQR